MENGEVFRARNSLILSVVAYAMLALFAYEEWLTASTRGFITACAALILVGQLTYLLMQRPAVVIGDNAIRIINPLSEHIIGWQDVETIEARYSMSIETKNGDVIYAWAASAPGRYHSRKIHPADVKGMNLGPIIRAGESPRTDSGVATHIARLKFADYNGAIRTERGFKRNKVGAAALAINIAAIVLLIIF